MVDGVEGLASVDKEGEELFAGLKSAVEKGVEVANVFLTLPPRDETFLGGVKKVAERRRKAAKGPFGDDPVTGIGDRDRASIVGSANAFLRKEEKNAIVEASGGEPPSAKKLKMPAAMSA